MNISVGRLGALMLPAVVAVLLAHVLTTPAYADGTTCNGKAPNLTDEKQVASPPVLHRCPRIGLKEAGDVFFISGLVPFTEDKRKVSEDIAQISSGRCSSGSADISSVRIAPTEKRGERFWSFDALGKCL